MKFFTQKPHLTVSTAQLRELYRSGVAMGLPTQLVAEKVKLWQSRAATTKKTEAKEDKQKIIRVKKQLPLWARCLTVGVPVLCVSIGLLLVGNAVLPIAWYYISPPQDLNLALLAPIPREEVLESAPLVLTAKTGQVQAFGSNAETSGQTGEEDDQETGGQGSSQGGDQSGATTNGTANTQGTTPKSRAPVVIANELDYTNLSNWFSHTNLPQVTQPTHTQSGGAGTATGMPAFSQIEEYTLDIPELNLENARVKVGGIQLDKNLIQYPGTANPGDLGAPVVFGHSVQRQFYNPQEKNPRRYFSIFSTIMTLKKGSKIYVTAQGVRYTYIVQEKTEVKPEDTYILEQHYDGRQLKLVTCVPEGTYLRRGVVVARLVEGE